VGQSSTLITICYTNECTTLFRLEIYMKRLYSHLKTDI